MQVRSLSIKFIAMVATSIALLTPCRARSHQPPGPFLWVEGESAQRSETHRNAWFDNIDSQELSAGAQIANFSEPKQNGGWAEYDLQVPQADTYHFWLRANPCSGISYRIDQGTWLKIDPEALQREDDRNRNTPGYMRKTRQWFNVAADGTQDARSMTWYLLPDVSFSQGMHTIRFSLGGDDISKARFAAIDCFVLTTNKFSPNFQYKPGEQPTDTITDSIDSTWPFDPMRDDFSPAALLDLRYLNEKIAGQHGFIRVSPNRMGFVRGDGQPIRFWGGCDYTQRIAFDENSQAVLEHHAQFLAKRGVNIVRLHGAIEPKGENSKIDDVDKRELDEIYRLVAGMKKAGIYTLIDPYWAVSAHAKRLWGVPDSGAGNLTGLIFFDKTLQNGYKAWLRRIYADVNPYTGIPLAKDPAVAMIQLQNEDSMLFWTMQSVKGTPLLNLRKLFGEFLLHKYGSFDKANAAWQNYKADDDNFDHGLPGLFIVWELTQDARNKKGQAPGREARLADQTEFFARTMYDFNKEMIRYLREDLGCKQLVIPGNWRTADQVILDDAERWSYTAGDVVAKNVYWTGIHNGVNTGWQILPGQVYTSHSFTKDPINSPMGVRQVVGFPFILPESLWVPPSHYESEGPLIVAGQSSLTGLGTLFWFATGEEEWQHPTSKWTFSIPTTLGQFPAAALAYRKGYIAQGPVVVHEERRLSDVFARKLPLIVEEGAWDPNRDTGSLPAGTPYKAATDPLAYLVGRAEVKYGGDPKLSKIVPLDKYIDRKSMRVKSITGQIVTDFKLGLYLVNAPRIQAEAGFLGAAGKQSFSDVDLDCKNTYASVAVASLDGAPLSKSHKILVQVGTESRPTGWKERSLTLQVGTKKIEGRRILDTGQAPWRLLKADLKVTIRNTSLHVAYVLDTNGNTVGTVDLNRSAGQVSFMFPKSALYVVVE